MTSRAPRHERLRAVLEQIVHEQRGGNVSLEHVTSERSAYSSSYDINLITLHLSDGEQWMLLQKDLGHSRVVKDQPHRRRERELCVYRELLADQGLGTPALYASRWDEQEQVFWLFMELVPGMPVRAYDVEYWVMAVGWLGRLQVRFAQQLERLKACRFLVRHDRNFYGATLEQSLREVSQASADLLPRWAGLAEAYVPFLDMMAAQPTTLVHGDYQPHNVLVDPSREPARICPVDWERAAVGSALYDIAFLADGFGPPELERMFEAYRREARDGGVTVPANAELMLLVDCFRFFRIVALLSRANERGFSANHIADLLGRAQDQLARLQAA